MDSVDGVELKIECNLPRKELDRLLANSRRLGVYLTNVAYEDLPDGTRLIKSAQFEGVALLD